MKLLHLTAVYPSYLRNFYARQPSLAGLPFEQQKRTLDFDAFAPGEFWCNAMRRIGYEAESVVWNHAPMQAAWWRENFPNQRDIPDLARIALEQVKKFRPEVLWFDDWSEPLLRELRREVPSLRVVLGWTGSAIPTDMSAAKHMTLLLSCAPESVDIMRDRGVPTEHIHHGFDERVPQRLPQADGAKLPVTFIGQLVRGNQFHNERAILLEKLSERAPLVIFSDAASYGAGESLKSAAKVFLYHAYRTGSSLGLGSVLDSVPVLKKQKGRTSAPVSQRNRKLEPLLRPARFGLEMYSTIRDSQVSLNIHADSSPRFASNMRLFEGTGAGTCLLTDWRENLPELYRVDEEVVSYRSADECAEKARWLLDHPGEAARIAAAGRARTLRDHTYLRRAARLDQLIRERL